jgi:hypothetical protein
MKTITTFAEIQEWIEEHVKIDPPTTGIGYGPITNEETPESKAIWFVCYEKATEMRECYDTKDYAYEVQQGNPPMNTRQACEAWLQDIEIEWTDAEMREFYGTIHLKS